jgi:predicted TIM-barrel fold metal-dependent hydrolase
MPNRISRRKFLGAASTVAVSSLPWKGSGKNALANTTGQQPASSQRADRIVDMHVHFDEANPNFVSDLLKLCGSLNLTACVLTPFSSRKVVAEAARQRPNQIVPFGYVDLDAHDAVQQVEQFHALGYRGLGELEFVKKPFNDPSYFPVYELANRYSWIVLFHTGIVLRAKFDEPEDVASGRMRPIHLEEIARRFPKITVLGAHCGNPEYEWAARDSALEPKCVLRPQRVLADQDAGAPGGSPQGLLVVWKRLGNGYAEQGSQRLHQDCVWFGRKAG